MSGKLPFNRYTGLFEEALDLVGRMETRPGVASFEATPRDLIQDNLPPKGHELDFLIGEAGSDTLTTASSDEVLILDLDDTNHLLGKAPFLASPLEEVDPSLRTEIEREIDCDIIDSNYDPDDHIVTILFNEHTVGAYADHPHSELFQQMMEEQGQTFGVYQIFNGTAPVPPKGCMPEPVEPVFCTELKVRHTTRANAEDVFQALRKGC